MLEELYTNPKEPGRWDNAARIAKCTSTLCENIKDESCLTSGAEKGVSLGTVFCPDCGHALFWTRVGKGMNNFVEFEDKESYGRK